MTNQIVVITGANAGIGRATALRLASCGATVVLGCRDIKKGIEAAQHINNELQTLPIADYPVACKGKAIFMRLDLSDLPTVIEFANRLKLEFPRIDVLINNAGLNTKGMLPSGIEQLFQVNYLGHYLLLRCLQSHLCSRASSGSAAAPGTARVVNLSSVMHHTGQPNFVASASGTYNLLMTAKASYYADSKLYMHYLTMEANRRLDTARTISLRAPGAGHNSYSSFDNESGNGSKGGAVRPVVALSVNPGAVRSEIWRNYPFQTVYNYVMKLVFLEVEEGCASSVFAATAPLEDIRRYQEGCGAVNDVGGRFLRRPDVPYVVPYRVSGCLAREILGVYEGCEFSGVTLPTEQEVERSGLDEAASKVDTRGVHTGRQPVQVARRLWAYSAELCYRTLLKMGSKEEDIKFLLE